ncbi:MAG: substrate-binding domain-containing protein [Halanaerobiales bacterium]
MKVPGDISVAGIGNITSARYSYPPLTTINIPIKRIAEKVGRYILHELEGDERKKELAVYYKDYIELVEQGSVKEV